MQRLTDNPYKVGGLSSPFVNLAGAQGPDKEQGPSDRPFRVLPPFYLL